ncbi:nucleoside transporter-domain-containing protein [Scleroderma yunnanense]
MAATSRHAKYQALPTSEDIDHVHSEANADTPVSIRDPPPSAPLDRQINFIYFILGCAMLLPWNALINATPFFLSRLLGSPLRPVFSSYQSSSFNVTAVLFQAYYTLTSKQASNSRRVSLSIITLTGFLFLIFLSTFIQINPALFFSFVLFSSICMSAAGACLSTAIFAGAALLGRSYMQAMVSGQAAVGVVVSVVQLISSAISVWDATPEDIATFIAYDGAAEGVAEEQAAQIFFGVSVLFMASTLATHIWLTRQPLYKSTVGLMDMHKPQGSIEDTEERHGFASGVSPSDSWSDVLRVLNANLIFMFSIAYTFIVTLAVFPSITVTVLPTNPNLHPLLFVSTHFLAFNAGDLLGRYISRRILAMSLLRTLFIPIVLLCNVQRPTAMIPPVISSDFLYMLIVLVIGITNGYGNATCFLAASSIEHNFRLKGYEDVDIAATLSGFSIVVGLAIGSLVSFGVRAAI